MRTLNKSFIMVVDIYIHNKGRNMYLLFFLCEREPLLFCAITMKVLRIIGRGGISTNKEIGLLEEIT